MMLAVYSVLHFLTDAVCASSIFSSEQMIPFILLYDLLAFSTQTITGILADFLKRYKLTAVTGGIVTALGALPFIPSVVRICMLGLGNSIFHVGGGAAVLTNSNDKAAPLGIFVAPGSMGLLLGTLFPGILPYASAILLALSIFTLFMKKEPEKDIKTTEAVFTGSSFARIFAAAIILLSISVRAVASYSVVYEWKTTIIASIILGIAVLAGKTAGGFILDKIKAYPLVILSIAVSGPLIAFFSANPSLSVIGQFLINCSMPLTLFMLYKLWPDNPGFAFGLAASFLFPAMTIGLDVDLSALVIFSIFTATAVLMIFAVKILKRGNIDL